MHLVGRRRDRNRSCRVVDIGCALGNWVVYLVVDRGCRLLAIVVLSAVVDLSRSSVDVVLDLDVGVDHVSVVVMMVDRVDNMVVVDKRMVGVAVVQSVVDCVHSCCLGIKVVEIGASAASINLVKCCLNNLLNCGVRVN